MLILAGTLKLQSGKLAEVLPMVNQMERDSQTEEGCKQYRFYTDPTTPDTFFIFEIWESAEALSNHSQSDHFKAFNTALAPVLDGRPSLKRYEVTDPQ